MAMALTSPEDALNDALRQIGYKLRVASVYDGSEAANAALDLYSQTLDAVLRTADWNFAQAFMSPTLSGQTAPPPWSYEYHYPTDCIRVRNVFFPTYLADRNNPLPSRWTIGNNTPGNKVLWTTAVTPRIVYTKQVIDPTKWEPLFAEGFMAQLGAKLAPLLTSPDMAKVQMQNGASLITFAEAIEG